MARHFNIGFGMVNIPCLLEGAATDKTISLNNIHTECKSRLKAPKWCPTCEREVQMDEIQKGYKLDKTNTVLLTKADMDNVRLESLKSIQIDAFVPDDLYEGPLGDPRIRSGKDAYYLVPEEVGAKAFVLFSRAMEKAGLVGVAKITMSTKEQLCIVYPDSGVLWLQTLRWADELKEFGNSIPMATVSDKEMEMATALISAMPVIQNFSGYKDEYRDRLVEVITAKMEGREVEPLPETKATVNDLEAMLTASLAAVDAK